MSRSAACYPLRFAPIYVEKIWGGDNLRRLLGRPIAQGARIGESWELADLEDGASVVINGPESGASLRDLTRRLGPALLGKAKAAAFSRFPLLVKLLDAQDILSLQVHPDTATAAAMGMGVVPKCECWYVLNSRSGSIRKGLKHGVTPNTFRRALSAGNAGDLVPEFRARRGDFHYLPGGTVHALGPKVVVVEIQTPSDTTFRVTDWGRGRDIHVEESLQAIHFAQARKKPPGAGGELLASCEFFTVARRKIAGGRSVHAYPPGRCTVLTFVDVEGEAQLRHAGSAEPLTAVRAGDTVLLPAGAGQVTVASKAPCGWLETTLPER